MIGTGKKQVAFADVPIDKAAGYSCLAVEATRKLADLQNLEATLTDMAARCTGDAVPDCHVVDVLSDPDQRPAP